MAAVEKEQASRTRLGEVARVDRTGQARPELRLDGRGRGCFGPDLGEDRCGV